MAGGKYFSDDMSSVLLPPFDDLDGESCLVGEVVRRGWYRQMTDILDVSGEPVSVYFYHDNGDTAFDFKELAPGTTLCVRNAYPHTFMDGQVGIRIEELSEVFGEL